MFAPEKTYAVGDAYLLDTAEKIAKYVEKPDKVYAEAREQRKKVIGILVPVVMNNSDGTW